MRWFRLLLIAAALPSGGCAVLVKNSGDDLVKLHTRSDVHERYGSPVATDDNEGHEVEEFVTHRKIAEPWKYPAMGMGYAMTYGLGEFVWLPQEVYVAAKRAVLGQRLWFTYDDCGRVVSVRHDGEEIPR